MCWKEVAAEKWPRDLMKPDRSGLLLVHVADGIVGAVLYPDGGIIAHLYLTMSP